MADGKMKTVQGVSLTSYFAVQQESMGWTMTHIPSGRLVFQSPFESKELALGFAQAMAVAYQEKLVDRTARFIVRPETETQKQLTEVIRIIATENPAIVNTHYLDQLMQ